MSLPTVYLSGPIAGLTYDGCTDWRKDVMAQLAGIAKCLDPMRAKDFLKDSGVIDHDLANPGFIQGPHAYNPLATKEAITCRDRFDTMNCTLLLVNLIGASRISVGTILEIGWADMCRKPIVLCMEPGNSHDHPMIRQCSGFILPTLEEGIAVVKAILS